MRLTSWNLLHGMAIPPDQKRDLLDAVASLASDFYGFQEVDYHLPRSSDQNQVRAIAERVGASHWAFAPSIIGTPGEKWRKLNERDSRMVTDSDQPPLEGSYGIGIVSTVPVTRWDRLDLGNSPVGMPLLVPGGEDGKGKPRFIYVRDEPRVALAATLSNGWTIINTHLSFVPGFNLAQLARIKKWALQLERTNNSRAIIMGDLNLPKNLPVALSRLRKNGWSSLVTQNSYPSWGAKIQFDYLLARALTSAEYNVEKYPATGVSDHLPIGIHLY